MKKNQAAEEAALADLLKSDPQQGLAEAIQLWGGAAKALCRGQLRGLPEEEVEECLADCFAALWRDIGNWQPQRGPLKGWFYGLCRHLAAISPPIAAEPPAALTVCRWRKLCRRRATGWRSR